MPPEAPPPGSLPEAKPPRMWYHSVGFVLTMLFAVLGPLGLPFLWRSSAFSRWAKWTLTVVMVLYTAAMVVLIVLIFRYAVRIFSTYQTYL